MNDDIRINKVHQRCLWTNDTLKIKAICHKRRKIHLWKLLKYKQYKFKNYHVCDKGFILLNLRI